MPVTPDLGDPRKDCQELEANLNDSEFRFSLDYQMWCSLSQNSAMGVQGTLHRGSEHWMVTVTDEGNLSNRRNTTK